MHASFLCNLAPNRHFNGLIRFDEAAGNAQASNFGRGGFSGDAINAEAQDFSGLNNANMSTPDDGLPPRMQVFLWTGTIDVALSDAELAERRRAWTPRKNGYQSGTLWKYAQLVGDAEKGAVTHPGAAAETHVYADI